MNCVICRNGATRRGSTTVTLDRAGATVIVRGFPADVCTNCGEEYLDEATTTHLLRTADAAVQSGVRVEIRDYLTA